MREFWQSVVRGTPMTRKVFWRALEILGIVSLVVGVVTAPFVVPNIENPLYRSVAWGFFIPLVIIIAFSIGLMPYFGMRAIKNELKSDYDRDTTKLSTIIDQKNNITQFLSAHYSHLYLRNNRQVDIEIEWFNGTIFELEFQLTSGIVKINDLESKVSSVEKRSCSHGKFCSYTVTLTDKDILGVIKDSISNSKAVKLFVVLHTDTKVTYEFDDKPESTRQFDAQCLIDNIFVIPQKV